MGKRFAPKRLALTKPQALVSKLRASIARATNFVIFCSSISGREALSCNRLLSYACLAPQDVLQDAPLQIGESDICIETKRTLTSIYISLRDIIRWADTLGLHTIALSNYAQHILQVVNYAHYSPNK